MHHNQPVVQERAVCRQAVKWVKQNKVPWLDLSPELVSWLKYRKSTTKRFSTLSQSQGKYQVNVLRHEMSALREDDIKSLKITPKTQGIIRETILSLGDRTCMFARSIFPESSLQGENAMLRKLGSRSLGRVLFSDETLSRTPFEFAALSAGQCDYDHIAKLVNEPLPKTLWARRSIFQLHGKPLLVMEVMLPGLHNLDVE